jgi:hypothetical protein
MKGDAALDEYRYRFLTVLSCTTTFVLQLIVSVVAGYWAFWRYGTIDTPTHQPRGFVVAKIGLPGGKTQQPHVCEVLGNYEIKNVGTGNFQIRDMHWAIFRMTRIDLPKNADAISVSMSDRLTGMKPLASGVIPDSSNQIGSQLTASWSLGWQLRDEPPGDSRRQYAFWVWPNLTMPNDIEKTCGEDPMSARTCPYIFMAAGYGCKE